MQKSQREGRIIAGYYRNCAFYCLLFWAYYQLKRARGKADWLFFLITNVRYTVCNWWPTVTAKVQQVGQCGFWLL